MAQPRTPEEEMVEEMFRVYQGPFDTCPGEGCAERHQAVAVEDLAVILALQKVQRNEESSTKFNSYQLSCNFTIFFRVTGFS